MRVVIVLEAGWIFAGDVIDRDGRIYLERVVWVFSWERIGFSEVVINPKRAEVDIRPIANLDIPAKSELFRIPVDEQWGL